jgi:hypothetical protein
MMGQRRTAVGGALLSPRLSSSRDGEAALGVFEDGLNLFAGHTRNDCRNSSSRAALDIFERAPSRVRVNP